MIEDILETLARPGLLGIVGQTVERKFQGQLKQYFKVLAERVQKLELQRVATVTDPAAASAAASPQSVPRSRLLKQSVRQPIRNCLRRLTPTLKLVLETYIAEGMLRSEPIHHFAEASDDAPKAYLTGEEAALYASVRAGEIVAGINDTTQEQIADAIASGITNRLGVDGTASLLRQTLSDMGTYRSRMIASTEMNNAFSQATLRKLDRMGVGYKVWIVSTACCDECAENEDAGPIPVDDDFPSGDDAPPAHPLCRCAVSGARAPDAA